jgi:hypothetical protein
MSNERFEELKPYWEALDRLFPAAIIGSFTKQQLIDYEKLCEAILNAKPRL